MFGRFSNAIDTLLALQEAVEAARTSDYFGYSTTSHGMYPSVNVFQDGDKVILKAEIPGVRKEDISIQIKENLITLTGNRKVEYPENASIHRMERRSHRFNRSMRLPLKVDADKSTAEYQDGILTVTLPQAESDKPRTISVT